MTRPGTIYNAATAPLVARHAVTPGAHTLYLAIFDQGDDILDSAVFLDHLTFSATDTAATCNGDVDRTASASRWLSRPAPTPDVPAFSGTAGTRPPTPTT